MTKQEFKDAIRDILQNPELCVEDIVSEIEDLIDYDDENDNK